MRHRRVAATMVTIGLGLIGATLIWTAVAYLWLYFAVIMVPVDRSPVPEQPFFVPNVGIIAMYYLFGHGLGYVHAVAVVMCAGVAACVGAYVVIRRFR